MKLETESERIYAQLAIEILHSKLIALLKSERFDEVAFMFGEQKTARGMILALFLKAEELARVELGLPPKPASDPDAPGIQ